MTAREQDAVYALIDRSIFKLKQWFPNLFEPLPKSRHRLCLITLNKKFFAFQVENLFCSDRS